MPERIVLTAKAAGIGGSNKRRFAMGNTEFRNAVWDYAEEENACNVEFENRRSRICGDRTMVFAGVSCWTQWDIWGTFHVAIASI